MLLYSGTNSNIKRVARLAVTILVIAAPLLALTSSLTSIADAAPLPVVKPSLTPIKGGMTISFATDSGPVPIEHIKVKRDRKRTRFKVELNGYQCERQFMRGWRAAGLQRALLYPSKKQKGRCYLLVRMRKRIKRAQWRALNASQVKNMITFSLKPSRSSKAASPKVAQASTATPSPKGTARSVTQGLSAVSDGRQENSEKAAGQARDNQIKGEQAEALNSEETAKTPMPQTPSEASTARGELISAPTSPIKPIEAPRDQLSARDKPDEVIETAVLGQINKARTLNSAPIILSAPMVMLSGSATLTVAEADKFRLSSELLTTFIDQEALRRGGSIWIADARLRQQIERLNPHSVSPQILGQQERAVARHVGATLISRTQLSLNKDEFILTTSMTPVGQAQATNQDAGVYKVEHTLSRAIIEAAVDQAWIVEERSSSVWRALLVPGWGHLYRGERRQGVTYLSLGLGLAASAIVSGGLGYFAARDYSENDPRTTHRRDDANAHYDRANLLWVGAALVHVTSIIDTLISARDRAYLDPSRVNWDLARDVAESIGGE